MLLTVGFECIIELNSFEVIDAIIPALLSARGRCGTLTLSPLTKLLEGIDIWLNASEFIERAMRSSGRESLGMCLYTLI